MKVIIVLLVILTTTGCQTLGKQAVYKYEECRYLANGDKLCKKASVASRRELENLYIKHGDTEVKTGQITGTDSPLHKAFAEALGEAIKKLDLKALLGGAL